MKKRNVLKAINQAIIAIRQLEADKATHDKLSFISRCASDYLIQYRMKLVDRPTFADNDIQDLKQKVNF